MKLLNQVALVTGASRGIGREIAVCFAEQGCDIAINYHRDEAGAQETARMVEQLGRRALVVQADVAELKQCELMTELVCENFDRIDILINNAGITRDKLLLSMDSEDIEAVVRTNLLGVIYPTKAVAMQMVRRRSGRIVNMSSSAAGKPGRGQSNYAAAKGGVESFTRAMAVELSPRNILVNAIAPGVIVTDLSADIRKHGEDEIKARLLLKRYAEPREVAEAALFLASPTNLYMTGEVLHLDGGLKMA